MVDLGAAMGTLNRPDVETSMIAEPGSTCDLNDALIPDGRCGAVRTRLGFALNCLCDLSFTLAGLPFVDCNPDWADRLALLGWLHKRSLRYAFERSQPAPMHAFTRDWSQYDSH